MVPCQCVHDENRVKNPAASYGALTGRILQIQAELILMLQLDDMSPQFRKMDVASQPVCDVTGSIPDIACLARTNDKPLRRRRISAFLPPASCGVSTMQTANANAAHSCGFVGSDHRSREHHDKAGPKIDPAFSSTPNAEDGNSMTGIEFLGVCCANSRRTAH